jgi:hypothetical protein
LSGAKKVILILIVAAMLSSAGIYLLRLYQRTAGAGVGAATMSEASTPSGPLAPASIDAGPTRVVEVRAVSAAGEVRPDFIVEPSAAQVEGCIAADAAVTPGIASCIPHAAAADVCWVQPDKRTLLCGVNPWEQTLVRVVSDEQVDIVRSPASPQPWGLELATGQRCRLRNGGSWPGRSDGYNGAYGCEGISEAVLIHEDSTEIVDRTDAVWKVRVGELAADNNTTTPPRVVEVAVAYFAAVG